MIPIFVNNCISTGSFYNIQSAYYCTIHFCYLNIIPRSIGYGTIADNAHRNIFLYIQYMFDLLHKNVTSINIVIFVVVFICAAKKMM